MVIPAGKDCGAILLVDDEPLVLSFLERIFRARPWRIDTAADAGSAIARIRAHPYDVIVTDKNLPGIESVTEGGLEVLRTARHESPLADVIVITGYTDAESAVAALRDGARDYIPKPFTPDRLLGKVDELMRRHALLDRERVGPALHALRGSLYGGATGAVDLPAAERSTRFSELIAAYQTVVDALVCRDRRIIADLERLARVAALREQAAELLPDDSPAREPVERMRVLLEGAPTREA